MKAGVYPASVTPFDAKGRVDTPGIVRLISWFKAAGCTGIVLAGTNGEGPSLSAVEKRDLVKAAVAMSDGLEVVLGIATSSLDEATWLCAQTYQAGAQAALVMPPGYFRDVSEDGIAKWFEAVMDKSPVGVIVYNFPQRTGITISAETMRRLSRHEKMLGLKDSSGNQANLSDYADALKGSGKLLYVGNETLLVDALAAGWTGTISGAANVIPLWLSRIVAEFHTDRESAETKFALIEPVLKAIRTSPQPGANKKILSNLGVLDSAEVRLPLEEASSEQVQAALDLVRGLTKQ